MPAKQWDNKRLSSLTMLLPQVLNFGCEFDTDERLVL
jgi:hypothetical protein